MHAIDSILAFVRGHQDWALPIVFLLAFGESLAFISLLLPSTVILVGISTILGGAGIAPMTVLWLWVMATVGSIVGYTISFWLGLWFKEDVHQWGMFRKRPGLLERGHAFFERWGVMGVFLGHFFGPVRAVIPVVAGIVAMRQLPFQIVIILASGMWSAGVLVLPLYGVQFLSH